ncbi:hypothetical protein CEE37_03425 [candidate division LCP-89 bacterium B3_LCP]|uniref:CHAT domain-containing protein n=1 Tax=candidate division LCP-89 bacterium B3_LCP TaxID=2012998 RepID=A0A532V333_UNCL8|nr:MAG: hypothetical protein CEE37_03425 [candidate division LCP-89 bacterium B3_LCP]
MMLKRISFLILLLSAVIQPACPAETIRAAPADSTELKLQLPHPLTAALSSEIDPAISPDGRWLLYVSNSSGNYDLWIRPLEGGVPIQLTSHPADDFSPVWSPKGNRICFVSMRDDPAGDIYTLKFSIRSGKPRSYSIRRIVEKPGWQSFPSYSEDAKYIVYQDGVSDQGKLIMRRIGKRGDMILTASGYVQPCFNPTNNRILCLRVDSEKGINEICIIQIEKLKDPAPTITTAYASSFPATLPRWAPNGKSFCAALVNQDRDEDGLLTAQDGQSLYRFDLVSGEYHARPVSIGDASENYPCWAEEDFIYHVSNRRGNADIWRSNAAGPIPRSSTAEMALDFAKSIGREAKVEGRSLTEREKLLKLLAFQKVRTDFPDARRSGALSMIQSAKLLQIFEESQKSQTFLKRIPRVYSEQRAVIVEAEIDYQLYVHKVRFSDDKIRSCENPFSLIINLGQIASRYRKVRVSSARVHYLIGAIHEYLDNIEKALASYRHVTTEYPEAEDHPAEALLRIAAIYAKMGSDPVALQTYLEVITLYSLRTEPTNKAILELIKLQVSGDDPIAGLQQLINKYPDIPSLGAASQYEIAEILRESGEIDLALSEYARLRGYAARNPTPYIEELFAKSLLISAELENDRQQFLIAQAHLQEVEEKFGELKEGFYGRKARFLRVNMLAERADILSSTGDWELALVNYEKAILLDQDNVKLHRGRIEAATNLGSLGDILEEYSAELKLRPNDPALLYASGLCHSYQGEKNDNYLHKSNDLIEKALTIEPEIGYGYLTLAYNYEMLETRSRLKSAKPVNTGRFLSNVGQSLTRFFRAITFQGNPGPLQGYEKAIETLQLGLAVNDEATDSALEAKLLLNLGNNYFHLGEFGYPRALEAYERRMQYDTTFTSLFQKGITYERMGKAGAISGGNKSATQYYQHSLKVYHDLGKHDSELRVTLRLAELYQVLEDEEESNYYYREALLLKEKENLPSSPTRWWENMAYNSLKLGDDTEAHRLSKQALSTMPPDEEIPLPVIENPLIIEIMGIPVPVWNFGYLGTGSAMSAAGMGQIDEVLLNHSILQDVSDNRKDVRAAKREVNRRLAIAIRRQDAEAEAIGWNELGVYFWSEGKSISARRCFQRAYRLAEKNGYRSGELTSLINSACISLSTLGDESINVNTYLEEVEWFVEEGIGFDENLWGRIQRGLLKCNEPENPSKIRRSIKREFQQFPDSEEEPETELDWSLLNRLLLLGKRDVRVTNDLMSLYRQEINRFSMDPLGFGYQRIRINELYSLMCLQAAAKLQPSSPEETIQQLDLQGEALWAMRSGIGECEKRGFPHLQVRLRCLLSDYFFSLDDLETSASELHRALTTAKKTGRDDLVWRVQWRLGRIAILSEQRGSSGADTTLRRVLNRSAEEWFEVAADTWADLPEDTEDFGGISRRKCEAKIMYELSFINAFASDDLDGCSKYAQILPNLSLLEATSSRTVPVQFERRKFIWGHGGGTIPYLRREMVRKRTELADLRSSAEPDTAGLYRLIEELRSLEIEYSQTIEDVIRDDPEFASLFYPVTIPLDSLKKTLQQGDLAVQLIQIANDQYYLLLNRDSLVVFQDFNNLITDSIRTHILPDSIERILDSTERLFMIASSDTGDTITDYLQAAIDTPTIYYLPDLQSLSLLQKSTSLSRGANLSLAVDLDLKGLMKADYSKAGSVLDEIEKARLVLIKPEADFRGHPLDRRIISPGEYSWCVRDLFSIYAEGDILIIIGSFPEEGLLAKIGFFAGFSNVIFIPDIADGNYISGFMEVFTEEIETKSPGSAFDTAMRNLQVNGALAEARAKFRYYGLGGMDLSARQEYAKKHFNATILKGNHNLEKGDGEWALRYYDSALNMAIQLNDSVSIANLHKLKIRAARISQNWAEAANSQTTLNEIAQRQDNTQGFEKGLRNLSVYLRYDNQLQEAIQTRRNAQRLALQRGDDLQAAYDEQILANLYELTDDYSSAESAITDASSIFWEWEEIDQFVISGIYQSRLYLAQDRFSNAVNTLKSIEEHIAELDWLDWRESLPIEYYQHLGLAYEGLADYEKALVAQFKALNIAGEKISPASALTYQYIAGLYWKMGDYQDALSHLKNARDQFRELGLTQYRYLTQNTEALIYLNLGDHERAVEKAKNALQGAIEAKDEKSRSQIEKNIGLIELASGNAHRAKSRFQQALKIDLRLGTLRGQAYAYLDLANAYLQLEIPDSAMIALNQAFSLGEQISDDRVKVRSMLGMGIIGTNIKRLNEARKHLSEAYEISMDRGFNEITWRIELALAELEIADKKTADAIEILNPAIARVEAMRASIASENLKSGFMEDKNKLYQLAVELYLDEDNVEAAFEIAERSRSRSFLDLLQRGGLDRKIAKQSQYSAELSELLQNISVLKKRRDTLQAKGDKRTAEESEILWRSSAAIDSLEGVYVHLSDELETENFRQRDLFDAQPEKVKNIRQILEDDEALIEYYFLDGEMVIFLATSEKLQVRKVVVGEDSLRLLISDLRYKLDRRLSVTDESQKLYQKLIKPLEGHLQNHSHIIIVPMGALHYLPFNVLQNDAGEYLLDNFSISTAPSASVFSICRKSANRRESWGEYPISAFGNPSSELSHESLFFAEKEVASISFAFPAVRIFSGAGAREVSLIEQSDSSGTLHLACHGIFNENNPLFSTLFLAPDSTQDGRLEMHEIFSLNLENCWLVMLSACESGLSAIAGGDEIIGLNRAFIYAGTPRVISTLWEVDDLATAVLVKRFYRNLAAGLTPATALQHAQQHVRERINSHPAFWAAFVLAGEASGNLSSRVLGN